MDDRELRFWGKAGIRRSDIHSLRHSGASFLENANFGITTIRRLRGHENGASIGRGW